MPISQNLELATSQRVSLPLLSRDLQAGRKNDEVAGSRNQLVLVEDCDSSSVTSDINLKHKTSDVFF